MDSGVIAFDNLITKFGGETRTSWIRAVVVKDVSGVFNTLTAEIQIGPMPDSWSSRYWHYEQCDFISDHIDTCELMKTLSGDSETGLRLGQRDISFRTKQHQVQWRRIPSGSQYDRERLLCPYELFTIQLDTPDLLQGPQGYLIGSEETSSFPMFSVAYDAFFHGNYQTTGSQIPNLGQIELRVIDERTRIAGVGKSGSALQVTVEGSELIGKQLEMNSATERRILNLNEAGVVEIPLMSDVLPADAWIWIKDQGDWLDFRSLQSWGGHLSLDVVFSEEDQAATENANSVPNSPSKWLRDRSIDSARRALTYYVAGESGDFYLFAGRAIELAAKSRLASRNPVLLAPRDAFVDALALLDASDDFERLPTGTRTVSAMEAVKRVVLMHKAFANDQESIIELLRIRNGEVHVGLIDKTQQHRTVVTFLRAISGLLEVAPGDRDELWFPHHGLVRAILDQNSERVNRDVHLKISAAIERFKRIEALTKDQREAVVAMIERSAEEREVDQAEVTCPACQSSAVASGINEVEVGEPDFNRDGTVLGIQTSLTFWAWSLRCDLCGLQLDNQDELLAAGVPESWENLDKNVMRAILENEGTIAEYADLSGYEPDEDEFDEES